MSGYFYRLKPVDFRLRSSSARVRAPTWSTGRSATRTWRPSTTGRGGARRLGRRGAAPVRRAAQQALPAAAARGAPDRQGDRQRRARSSACTPFPTARGIISRPYKGRGGCAYCALCGSYGCEVGAKSGTHASLIPAALATGNVEIRPRCMARSIEVDAPTAARRASSTWTRTACAGAAGAKLIVVSCTAVESARLLLNSQSARFPNGLANNNGLVGKNLVFSSFGEVARHLPHLEAQAELALARRSGALRAAQRAGLLRDAGRQLRLPQGRHAGLHVDHPNPIFAAIGMAGTGKEGVFGKALKDKLREYRDSQDSAVRDLRRVPRHTTAPTSPWTSSVKDKYGLPVAAITIDRHPLDLHDDAVPRRARRRGAPGDEARRARAADQRGRDHHPPGRHLPLRQRPGDQRARPGLPGPRRCRTSTSWTAASCPPAAASRSPSPSWPTPSAWRTGWCSG